MAASRYYLKGIANWANSVLSRKVPVKGKRDELQPYDEKKIRVRKAALVFPMKPKAKDEEKPLDIAA